MMGNDPNNPSVASENAGLYVLAARDIFQSIITENLDTLGVFVSCFEIYGGKLYDLLNCRGAVKCLEDSKQQVHLSGLTEHEICKVQDLLDLMSKAHSQRSTGSTGANAESSRSHQVMQIVVGPIYDRTNISSHKNGRGKRTAPVHGKLSFIDLAGSERGADVSNNSKQTRLEGAEINTSLLALKEVIRSLVYRRTNPSGYTPFRGSKLTQVLKDSFVGENTRTCMIACVSPSQVNCEHTLNTLRYADRVKEHAHVDSRPYPPLSYVQNDSSEILQADKYITIAQDPKMNRNSGLDSNLSIRGNLNVLCTSKEYEDGKVADEAIDINVDMSSPVRPKTVPNHGDIQTDSNKNSLASDRSNLLATKEKLQLVRLKEKSANHGRKGFHTSNNGYSDINETNYDNDRVKGTSMGNSSQEKDSKNIPKAKSVSRMEKTINLLTLHKNVITDMVEIMKGEMELVQSMENTENRDGLQYASSLESTLDFKDQVLDTLRNELRILRGKIL